MAASAKDILVQTILVERDGGDELEISHGLEGSWRLDGATLSPHTTLAAHSSNTQTATLKKGAAGTTLGYMTSDSDDATYGAAFTKGTPRHFVLTAEGTDRVFTKDNVVEIAITEGGTAAALDCTITLRWVYVRG